MVLDLTELNEAIYGTLKTDAAGTAVRAAVGSVVPVADLPRLANDLPDRIILAYRRSAMPRTTELNVVRCVWSLLDDRKHGYRRIGRLPRLIASAYANATFSMPAGQVITSVELVAVSDELEDRALGLNLLFVTLAVRGAAVGLA